MDLYNGTVTGINALKNPQQPVQLVNFFDEIVVAYSYSIHYQPIGSHLSSIEEENNFGQILIL